MFRTNYIRRSSALYQMSKIAFDLSNKLVPYSPNQPDLARKLWQPHRTLVHYAANARKDKNNDKGKIKDLHLFIGNPKAELDYNSYIVSGEYFNTKNPSIEKLIEIIDHLPRHSDKKNHKPKDDYPFFLLHYPRNKKLTIKDLNEFLDDQQYSNGDICTTPLIIKKNNRYFIYGQINGEGDWQINSLPRELCFPLPLPKQSPFNDLQSIYYDPLLAQTIEKHLPLYHEIEKNNFHTLGREIDEYEFTQRIAKNAINFGTGNCGERSAVAFILLKEKKLIEKHFPELLKEDVRLERMCLASTYELKEQSEAEHKGGVFYLKETDKGLQYEIIGAKGKLIKGTLPLDKLPSDVPHELSKILNLDEELQDKLIKTLLDNVKNNGDYLPVRAGDHSFVIVNRDKNSNLYDLSTWGDHCLIVDAWMGDIIRPCTKTSLLSKIWLPNSYNYISSHAMCINLLDEATIGADYTPHWLRSKKLKNQNENLSDTKPTYTTIHDVDKNAQSPAVVESIYCLMDLPMLNELDITSQKQLAEIIGKINKQYRSALIRKNFHLIVDNTYFYNFKPALSPEDALLIVEENNASICSSGALLMLLPALSPEKILPFLEKTLPQIKNLDKHAIGEIVGYIPENNQLTFFNSEFLQTFIKNASDRIYFLNRLISSNVIQYAKSHPELCGNVEDMVTVLYEIDRGYELSFIELFSHLITTDEHVASVCSCLNRSNQSVFIERHIDKLFLINDHYEKIFQCLGSHSQMALVEKTKDLFKSMDDVILILKLFFYRNDCLEFAHSCAPLIENGYDLARVVKRLENYDGSIGFEFALAYSSRIKDIDELKKVTNALDSAKDQFKLIKHCISLIKDKHDFYYISLIIPEYKNLLKIAYKSRGHELDDFPEMNSSPYYWPNIPYTTFGHGFNNRRNPSREETSSLVNEDELIEQIAKQLQTSEMHFENNQIKIDCPGLTHDQIGKLTDLFVALLRISAKYPFATENYEHDCPKVFVGYGRQNDTRDKENKIHLERIFHKLESKLISAPCLR